MKKQLIVTAIFLYVSTISQLVRAQDILPIDCMIEPNIMVEISSPVDGVLYSLLVDRSDEVKEGEVIATLKSDVEKVAVSMSKERLSLTQVKYKRAKGLYRKKAITLTEIDQLENEKKLAVLDLKHARANLELKKIRSPIDGVVVKRFSTPGEFVEADPIIKLAQLDPLKIEVVSPVANYGKIIKGMRAEILPDFGGYPNLIAEVVVVDKVIDAASGTFGIRLELANKDHSIPSGLKCKVRFLPETRRSAIAKMQLESITETAESHVPDVSATDAAMQCLTVGPYKKKDTLNALIDDLGSDVKQTAIRSDKKVKTTYLVITEFFDSLKDTRKEMQSMKAAGITDVAIMNKKNGKYRLALGLYRRQAYAQERIDVLDKKGYKVNMKPVDTEIATYWADIAYFPESTSALNDAIPEKRRFECDEAIKLSLLK